MRKKYFLLFQNNYTHVYIRLRFPEKSFLKRKGFPTPASIPPICSIHNFVPISCSISTHSRRDRTAQYVIYPDKERIQLHLATQQHFQQQKKNCPKYFCLSYFNFAYLYACPKKLIYFCGRGSTNLAYDVHVYDFFYVLPYIILYIISPGLTYFRKTLI